MNIPISSADGTRDPAAPLHHSEFRCPTKNLDIISAQRCLSNLACPLSRSCEFRLIADDVVREAKREEYASGKALKAECLRRLQLCAGKQQTL